MSAGGSERLELGFRQDAESGRDEVGEESPSRGSRREEMIQRSRLDRGAVEGSRSEPVERNQKGPRESSERGVDAKGQRGCVGTK